MKESTSSLDALALALRFAETQSTPIELIGTMRKPEQRLVNEVKRPQHSPLCKGCSVHPFRRQESGCLVILVMVELRCCILFGLLGFWVWLRVYILRRPVKVEQPLQKSSRLGVQVQVCVCTCNVHLTRYGPAWVFHEGCQQTSEEWVVPLLCRRWTARAMQHRDPRALL